MTLSNEEAKFLATFSAEGKKNIQLPRRDKVFPIERNRDE